MYLLKLVVMGTACEFHWIPGQELQDVKYDCVSGEIATILSVSAMGKQNTHAKHVNSNVVGCFLCVLGPKPQA